MKAPSPNHRTTREFPRRNHFKVKLCFNNKFEAFSRQLQHYQLSHNLECGKIKAQNISLPLPCPQLCREKGCKELRVVSHEVEDRRLKEKPKGDLQIQRRVISFASKYRM